MSNEIPDWPDILNDRFKQKVREDEVIRWTQALRREVDNWSDFHTCNAIILRSGSGKKQYGDATVADLKIWIRDYRKSISIEEQNKREYGDTKRRVGSLKKQIRETTDQIKIWELICDGETAEECSELECFAIQRYKNWERPGGYIRQQAANFQKMQKNVLSKPSEETKEQDNEEA